MVRERTRKRGMGRAKFVFVSLLLTLAPAAAAAADAEVIAAAKKEGRVVWYTAQIINQVAQPIADAFAEQYGIKPQIVRADSAEITLRILNEAKAGRIQADVVDGTASAAALKRARLIMQWQPEIVKTLPSPVFDAQGYWTATNVYFIAPSFNTDLIRRGSEPRTWTDLLNSRYVGNIAISNGASTSGGAGLVGTVLHDMGRDGGMDYLRKLAMQKVALIGSSARTVTDQVMQGEYAIGLMMSNNQPVSSARMGAPVDTIPWSSSLAAVSAAAILADAPHPNAAKLFTEFMLSEHAQQIFARADYQPVNPAVSSREPRLTPEGGHFSAFYVTPEEVEERLGEWDRVFKSLFK